MEIPFIPLNEKERLESLYSYNLLDTSPEESYDDLVTIAATICGTPISLISLVDEKRCWFKAKLGLTESEVPRKITGATYALNLPSEFMIVEDILTDQRFHACLIDFENPTVRFYAGTPLVTPDGYTLGTLCVMDYVPRMLNEEQISCLKKIANQVVSQFELHKKINEVHDLNNKLNASYKEMESFSYSVSHDLKAPLRGIRSFTKLILEDYAEELSEDVLEMFNLVVESADRMDDLIGSTLNLAKVARKKIELKTINLSEISQQVIDELVLSNNYHINIADDLFAFGDAKLIRTVLANLIGNAIKYSSTNEHPMIEIGQTIQNNRFAFFVKDNGVGFDMKYAKTIFQPFQRLHSDSEFEGTGIGLAIVHKILQKHKGGIWVEAALGKGSIFYFTI